MTDLQRLTELKCRIDFLYNSTSAVELVHSIEQELTTFCEFQITFNKYNKSWEYYIRCSIKYSDRPIFGEPNRLKALYDSIDRLIKGT